MPQLVWLVTGCSSGFGEQFVHSIVARGDKVIATARKTNTFEALEQAGAATVQLDITDTKDNIQAAIDKAIGIHGRIDVLVNNAGYVSAGTWEDLEYEDFLDQFNTNVFGTIKVTRAVLPHFRQRKAGTSVSLARCQAGLVIPAWERLVESLEMETAHLGLKTLLIEPGRFRTSLLSSENRRGKESSISEYSDITKGLMNGLDAEDGAQTGDPVKLVEIIIDVVRQEGVARGKEIPFRLPLGIDTFDEMSAKLDKTQKLLADWKDVIRSTDYKAL